MLARRLLHKNHWSENYWILEASNILSNIDRQKEKPRYLLNSGASKNHGG